MIKQNFGKIVNGLVQYASLPLLVDGEHIWTNDPQLYKKAGYLPVKYTSKPSKEGFRFNVSYIEQDGIIMQVWEEHEIPKPVEEVEIVEEEVSVESTAQG